MQTNRERGQGMGSVYQSDIDQIAQNASIPWRDFEGKTIVVTGATGLVGGMLARAIIRHGELAGERTKVILPVRNMEKARRMMSEPGSGQPGVEAARSSAAKRGLFEHGPTPGCPEPGHNDVVLAEWNAATGVLPAIETCDYIIHCASNTNSKLMVQKPVDTIMVTFEGTRSMLDVARATGARMCFVSSMEVYGPGGSQPLNESHGGELDAMNVRSSYPQAKQMAETLCASYAKQYGVEVCVARLAQTFGPGVANTDARVFAEFARCCRDGKNISLLTDGSKSNMYVYTADAVAALLLLAARGAVGEAYNVANEQTFCSIWEMANAVSESFGTHTKVTRVYDSDAAARYAVSGSLRLDTQKIRAMGWEPTVGLMEMYSRMMADWDDQTEQRGVSPLLG